MNSLELDRGKLKIVINDDGKCRHVSKTRAVEQSARQSETWALKIRWCFTALFSNRHGSAVFLFWKEIRRFAHAAVESGDCSRRCWLHSLPASCGKSRVRRRWCCLPHCSQVAKQKCTVKKILAYSKGNCYFRDAKVEIRIEEPAGKWIVAALRNNLC